MSKLNQKTASTMFTSFPNVFGLLLRPKKTILSKNHSICREMSKKSNGGNS